MRTSAPAGPRGRGGAASQPRTRPAAAAPPPIRRDAPGRRRGLRLVVVAAATAGLVAGATWLVGWSPVLGVGTVTVQGSTRVDADRIVAAAAVEPGTPLARLDAEQIRSQVLAALPRIADVEVRRGWPRELVIVVDERVPVAVVAGDLGYRLVDASGAAYLDVTGQPDALPLLAVDPANTAAVAAGVAVAAGLPEDLRRRVTEISATTVDDVTLTMRSGAEVTWGNPEDTAVKSRVLAAMLGLDARAYDVSAPELPTSTGAANSRGRSDQTAGDDPAAATGSSVEVGDDTAAAVAAEEAGARRDGSGRSGAAGADGTDGAAGPDSTGRAGGRGDAADRQELRRADIARGTFPKPGQATGQSGSAGTGSAGTGQRREPADPPRASVGRPGASPSASAAPLP